MISHSTWNNNNQSVHYLFGSNRDPSQLTSIEAEIGTLSTNGFAPSLPAEFCAEQAAATSLKKLELVSGDFQIIRLLGQGAFGKVFLARQLSLNRLVAIKVTADRGYEGRMMAQLEHRRIVQVFSETVSTEHGIRMLCMQFVAGVTLQKIVDELARIEASRRSGRALVEILDRFVNDHETAFDPSGLRDRELLINSTLTEAVCWIGEQIAEALAFAHQQGVLHRDVKPANILLNQYGHPMLTDFSVAFQANSSTSDGATVLGGTMGFMSPEHCRAVEQPHASPGTDVDQRSDIFSLGKVLNCLLHTRSPTADLELSRPLGRIVGRCLRAEPTERFPTADELAAALVGCRQWLVAKRAMPQPSWFTRFAELHPVMFILVCTVVPNVFASAANVWYLSQFVIVELPLAQRNSFWIVITWYNAVVALAMLLLLDRTLLRAAREFHRERAVETFLRQQVLMLPIWCIVLGCVGWFPFAVVVPSGMELLSGRIPFGCWLHVAVAFIFTGMIAMTANYFVVSFVVIRSLYPRLWGDVADFRATAAKELSHIPGRNRKLQFLAALPPVLATSLLMFGPAEQFEQSGIGHLRVFVSILVTAGLVGSWFAAAAASMQGRTISALTTGRDY